MMTIKTRSASKAEKGTARLSPNRLSPNGKTNDELDDELEEDLDTSIDIAGILQKKKGHDFPILAQKYKNQEITAEEFKRAVDELRSTLVKMAEDMQSIADKVDDNARTQKNDLENLKIDVSGKIEDVNLNYNEMEKENKRLLKNSLQARQTANSNKVDITDLKRKVESHGLKINAANSYGNGGSWLLKSDEDVYPILKKDKTNHWSKYNANLKDIKLEGDSLQQLQKFWHVMDTALTSTLNSNKGLGDYEDLTESYFVK